MNFSWDAYDPICRNVMSLLGKMQNQDTRSYCYCSLNLLCEFFSSLSASSRRYTLLPIICQELTLKGWILQGFDFRCHDGKGKTCTMM